MKKKYITLEEALALRGTDTIFYKETILNKYFKFKDGLVCRFTKDGKMEDIGVYVSDVDKPYILEPEEKSFVTGLYKTRDGRVVFVSCIDEYYISGIVLGDEYATRWNLDGTFCGSKDLDLVKYIGESK